jgi:hypothetical protein
LQSKVGPSKMPTLHILHRRAYPSVIGSVPEPPLPEEGVPLAEQSKPVQAFY